MKNAVLISAAIMLLIGCSSKPVAEMTVADYTGVDSTKNLAAAKQGLDTVKYEMLSHALTRYRVQDSITINAKLVTDSILRHQQWYEEYVAPRNIMWMMAVSAVKRRLKVPDGARFPEFTWQPSDSMRFTIDGTTATVEGLYAAQNLFGVYLPGRFKATMEQDATSGIWLVKQRSYGGEEIEME